ncbi:hypothetical protein [Granulicella sibirica]|uniref:Uncharacterized protein n=1 Tax=Granulicella sibirica TaxID=2479048 RepID=A0A4Q0SWD9_9BACT|nr:hypothetical protein [Granulicella sibirica]RXH53878.1 hypothetical protein GRAN_5216 [Granulicella sibirica]
MQYHKPEITAVSNAKDTVQGTNGKVGMQFTDAINGQRQLSTPAAYEADE